jgi:FG-GAP-like repeat
MFDVGVLLGNGNGTFKPETLLPGFAVPTIAVAILDINNDGSPDLELVCW